MMNNHFAMELDELETAVGGDGFLDWDWRNKIIEITMDDIKEALENQK